MKNNDKSYYYDDYVNYNCKSFDYLEKMVNTDSYKILIKEYMKPKKETLEKFLLENSVICNYYLFINIFIYGYRDLEEYEKEMNYYTFKDLATYSYYNNRYYNEIRSVLRHMIKYNLLTAEQKDIVVAILNRSRDKEI